MQRSIVIWGMNSKKSYSGGRYHALMMAEALAASDHAVSYITNTQPAFVSDFLEYKNHDKIDLCVSKDLSSNYPKCEVDIVILVPGMHQDEEFYIRAINYAKENSAHLVFINFESGNWFNEYSPVKRDVSEWDNWIFASKYCSVILSSSEESTRYAKEFYTSAPESCIFTESYPSINQMTADSILAKGYRKTNRILMFARFSMGEHKGVLNIPDLISDAMSGYTLVFVVGLGNVPHKIKKEILEKAKTHNVQIEFKHTLSDRQKFKEFAIAKLVLFPSFFEGFGYPPVEALYCGTPCVAFDLPVLRETCGENLHYVPSGDWQAFKEKISEVLAKPQDFKRPKKISEIASFENYVGRMNSLIENLSNTDLPEISECYAENLRLRWKTEIEYTRPHIPKTFTRLAKKLFPKTLYRRMERIYHH